MPSVRYVFCTTLLASLCYHILASPLSTEKTTYAAQIEHLASDQLGTHSRNRLEAAYPHRLLPLGTLNSRHDLKDHYAREFDKRQTDNTTLVPTDNDSPTTTALTSSSFFSSSSVVAETTSDAPVTTTSTTPTTSSSPPNDLPPPQSSTQTGILIPITVTTTNSAGETETQTMPIFQSSASVSVVEPITTTDSLGQASTGTATIPGVVVTNINSVGQTVISTLPVSMATVAGGSLVDTAAVRTTTDNAGDTVVFSATSSGQVVSATKQGGVVVVITFTPSPIYLSEIVYKTTRLANGQQMTITTLEIVGQAAPTSTAGSGQTGTPKLATGAAARPVARDAGSAALFISGLLCLIVMI